MNKQQQILAMAMRDLFPDERVYETMLVVCYEFGDLAKSIFYSQKRGLREASKGEVKKAIGDLITQIKVVCSEMGIDYDECEQLGFEAMLEHFNRIKKGKE
jgi:hypothetical protein